MEYKLKKSIINGLLAFIESNKLDEADHSELEKRNEKDLYESVLEMIRAFNDSVEPHPIVQRKSIGEYEVNYYHPCGTYDDEGFKLSKDELIEEYKDYYFMVNVYQGIGKYAPTEIGVVDIHGAIDLLNTVEDTEQVHLVMPLSWHNYQVYIRKSKQGKEEDHD